MRFILTLLIVLVLVAIAAVWTGFVNLDGQAGQLPRVAVEGGRLPSVTADVGRVEVGTTNTTVEVPRVETRSETVELPNVEVQRPR